MLRKALAPVLCSLLILIACTKSNTDNQLTATPTSDPFAGIKTKGAIADDPANIANVPLLISSKYSSTSAVLRRGNTTTAKDSDNDGIPDASDSCPLQPETYNGYQDADGCPDTVPVTTTTDVTSPSVSFTAPANADIVSGTINLSVNATDNVGVSSVSYSVDGIIIGTSTNTPFSISWNSTSVADGSHTLTARAYDAAGNSSAYSISVSVKNVTVLPTPPLPSSVLLTMPPVGNQGAEGCCVAWAIAYYARSCEAYYRSNATSYSLGSNIFSPEFLFNQTKSGTDCSSGSSVLSTLDFVVNNGICTWQTMPYTSGNCSLLPTTAQKDEAAGFKISSYSAVFTSDITAIKTLLAQKHALLLGLSTDQQFDNAGPGFIWSSYGSATTSLHEVTICGYDDAKQAFKIVNSWGTSWGDAGYSWISYDFLPKLNNYVFVLNV